jgi:hypothetical protein
MVYNTQNYWVFLTLSIVQSVKVLLVNKSQQLCANRSSSKHVSIEQCNCVQNYNSTAI